MTDMTHTPTPNFDGEAWLARARERARLAAEALPANKAALFDVLAAFGIATVIVRFDGYGDSGQIEDIEAQEAGTTVALPESAIEFARPLGDGSGLERSTLPLCEAIEMLAYALLADTHGGWENSDGAYGDFTFDVATRTITLDYNDRFTDSENFQHTF